MSERNIVRCTSAAATYHLLHLRVEFTLRLQISHDTILLRLCCIDSLRSHLFCACQTHFLRFVVLLINVAQFGFVR